MMSNKFLVIVSIIVFFSCAPKDSKSKVSESKSGKNLTYLGKENYETDATEKEYYKNGQLKSKKNYHEDGVLIFWGKYYADGKDESKKYYNDNGILVYHLEWFEYYLDGHPKKKSVISYNDDGVFFTHFVYEYNEDPSVKTVIKQYDKNGNLIEL